MQLPLPGKSIPLRVDIALVAQLEGEESLCRIAERLVRYEVTFAESLKILGAVYAHAGAELSAEELGAFLLQNGPAPPVLLGEILLAILEPVFSFSPRISRVGEGRDEGGRDKQCEP